MAVTAKTAATPEAPVKAEAPVTYKVMIRPEYEGQTQIEFSINGEKKFFPTDTEISVEEKWYRAIQDYKQALKNSRDYRLKNEAYVRSLMRR